MLERKRSGCILDRIGPITYRHKLTALVVADRNTVAMSEQEIILPERGPHGHFAPGNKAGGRPPGVQNTYTKTIKDMVAKALEMVGGENYLAMVAVTQPAAFVGLVGKTMPLQPIGDAGMAEFIVTERRVIKPPKRDEPTRG